MPVMDIIDLREAIRGHRVRVTDHADEEAAADRLLLADVYHCVEHGEIIEDYPTDRPFPSCLIYGPGQGSDPIHSVWAYNSHNGWAVLITVYRPDPGRWINWRQRRTDA